MYRKYLFFYFTDEVDVFPVLVVCIVPFIGWFNVHVDDFKHEDVVPIFHENKKNYAWDNFLHF